MHTSRFKLVDQSISSFDLYSPPQGCQQIIHSAFGMRRRRSIKPHLDLIQSETNTHQQDHKQTNAHLQECTTDNAITSIAMEAASICKFKLGIVGVQRWESI